MRLEYLPECETGGGWSFLVDPTRTFADSSPPVANRGNENDKDDKDDKDEKDENGRT